MLKRIYNDHRVKIVIGTPVIFLLLLNSSAPTTKNTFVFTPGASVFLKEGDTLPIELRVNAMTSINALGGTIAYQRGAMSIENVDLDRSVIDLWAEEPYPSNSTGHLAFSGGIITEGGFTGNARVLGFNVLAKLPGRMAFTIENGMLLARDGKGTNHFVPIDPLFLYVRKATEPTPDTNGDGILSLADLNTIYLATFRGYQPRYDLNQDGKVEWGDVRVLINLLSG